MVSGHGSGTSLPSGKTSALNKAAISRNRPRCRQLNRRTGCWLGARAHPLAYDMLLGQVLQI